MVRDLHHRPEDMEDGDLQNRIEKFHTYVLQSLPLDRINLEEFNYDDDTVSEYAERIVAGEVPPPIVYDNDVKSIIDGMHRARAGAEAGRSHVDAYVGLKQNMDPDWAPYEDDEDY